MTVAAAVAVAVVVVVAVAFPSDWSARYQQFECSCLSHEACEASADAVIWESSRMIESRAMTLVAKNFEVEFGNYFVEMTK